MRKPFGQNRVSIRPESKIDRARRTGTIPAAMADAMIERNALSGNCTDDDLRLAGFTKSEVKTYGEAALEIALRRSEREAA